MLEFLSRPLKCRFGKDKSYFRIIWDIFGITPDNIELYKAALIHRSASVHVPGNRPINNERLEFLGDAILESIVSDFLFIAFPDEPEGFLTQMRSKIVSRSSLNALSQKIGLASHIIAHSNGAFQQKHLSGDALEAMIGAIYLDKGYDVTNRIVINGLLKKNLDLQDMSQTETDFKSRLIEWCQKSKHEIRFETAPTSNSTAQHPSFCSNVFIDGIDMGRGMGASKKEAEQQASFVVSGVLREDLGDHFLDSIDNINAGSEQNKPTYSNPHGTDRQRNN